MLKRAIDLLGAVLALVLLAPLLLAVAIAVKLSSAGPALYSQARVGRGGRIFRVHKFRTMVADADRLGPSLTGKADVRITWLGKILRPLRIDELPQLLNVVKGEMSLVGPRPEIPSVVDGYSPEEREILRVRPGLTGPTQLAWLDEAERYPPGVDAVEHYTTYMVKEKLTSDLHYVRQATLLSDVVYLVMTPLTIGKLVLSKMRLRPTASQLSYLGIDCVAVALANVVAFVVRFDGVIPSGEVRHILVGLLPTCAAYLVAFLLVGTYRSVWRYSGVEDLWRIIKAAAFGWSLHALAMTILGLRRYPRSTLVLTAVFVVLFMGGLRMLTRRLTGKTTASARVAPHRRVLIVGTGDMGESIARETWVHPELGYELVGFLSDEPEWIGATIHGVRVLGTTGELPEIVRVHKVDEVIIAVPELGGAEVRRLIRICAASRVKFKTLPSIQELVRGEGKLRYLRKLDTRDLLGREPWSVNDHRVAERLRGKRVMVTGAGGSIGSELCRQLLRLGVSWLVMVERAENALHEVSIELSEHHPDVTLIAALADVKHVPRMSEIFTHARPEIVFHAAAYKHVPILEDHPAEAVMNNVVGTRRMADLARRFEVEQFVLISTDKAVNPQNIMGATKRICEMLVTSLNRTVSRRNPTRFRVVRFGNVLGSAGSVVPLFQQQLENGQPITITDPEVSRFFMTVAEAVGLVLESTTLEGTNDMFVLNMGEPVKIDELADSLLAALGLSQSDVGRRYVGLRPGEKLHEALWGEDEQVVPTEHGNILALNQTIPEGINVETLLTELEELAISGSVGRLLRKIGDVIPTYRPSAREALSGIPEVGERYRVLVIDDDSAVRGVLVDALQGRFDVREAASAREGLALIQKEVPHVLMLDVVLPDGSGADLCRQLRGTPEHQQIGVIAMTGFVGERTAVSLLEAGADDCVTKPIHVDELTARIDAILRRRVPTEPMTTASRSVR